LGLTWDKVKLNQRVIKLDAEITKTQEARNVPICKELKAILMSLPSRTIDADDSRLGIEKFESYVRSVDHTVDHEKISEKEINDLSI